MKTRQASSQWSWTSYDIYMLEGWELPTNVLCLCYQAECCPKTQREHLQGFVKFDTHIRLRQLQRIFHNPKLHCEISRGSPLENLAYCVKEDSRLKGTIPTIIPEDRSLWSDVRQGRRSDLEVLLDMILQGMTDYDIMMAMPSTFMRYQRHVTSARYVWLQATTLDYSPVRVIVYWGHSRTGKTRLAIKNSKRSGGYFKVSLQSPTWFCGYQGEPNLIIDEFSGEIPLSQLLMFLDSYKCRLPVKGGFVMKQYSTIYITSNQDPRSWYPFVPLDQSLALGQRISKIVKFNSNLSSENAWPIYEEKNVNRDLVLPLFTSGQDYKEDESPLSPFFNFNRENLEVHDLI